MQDLIGRIIDLKNRRKEIILAHNCQDPSVQEIADIVGDSLELSRQASNSNADVVVLAGVRFMGETAKIPAPDKTVLLPDPDKQFHLLAPHLLCPDMKVTTAEKIAQSLEAMVNQVVLPPDIQSRARLSLERMLEVG